MEFYYFYRANGKTFTASPSKQLHTKSIGIGDVVTYTYSNANASNMPVHAVIQRKRSDMTWDDVLQRNYDSG